MPINTKLALATLLVFDSASAALAESNIGTNHRGPFVRGRTSPTMFEAPQPKAARQVRSLLPDRPHGIVMN